MRNPEAPPARNVAGAVLAGTLAMTMTAGCVVRGEGPSDVGLPPGLCSDGPLVPQEDEDRTSDRALACERVMREGRVALVVYGDVYKTPEELEQDAHSMEEIVREATDGMVNISVDVLHASPEAVARRKETLSGIFGCVDYKKGPSLSSSHIAAAAMPELDNYDSVVSAEPWPACDSDVGGGFTQDGRYSNVHMGGQALELLPTRKGMVGSPMAVAAAHEFLHQLGLKHNGRIKEAELPKFGGVLDARALAAGKRTEPHGIDGSIMTGALMNHIYIQKIAVNPIDLDRLRWPAVVLEGAQPYATAVTSDGVVLDTASYERQFFTLQLGEPVTFSDYKRADGEFVGFDKLNIIPVRSEDGARFSGITLCYESDGETVAPEGESLRGADGPGTMTVEYGGQRVEVRISPGGESITARLL